MYIRAERSLCSILVCTACMKIVTKHKLMPGGLQGVPEGCMCPMILEEAKWQGIYRDEGTKNRDQLKVRILANVDHLRFPLLPVHR